MPTNPPYPYWEIPEDDLGHFTVEIFGEDGLYDRLRLPPDPAYGYGYETAQEARAGAVKMLRNLADRIERGES